MRIQDDIRYLILLWNPQPANIIFGNTDDKRQISKILTDFNKRQNIWNKLNKYHCSIRLLACSRCDLELSKLDLENHIEAERRFTAFLSLFGVIVSQWIFLASNGNPDLTRAGGAIVFFALIGIYLLYDSAKKNTWLHIIKMALARKTK
jgi:multisubunit Na+/H+ antiporter MnhB subunit